jgi:phosphoribosylamine--glycine ligase
MRPILVLGSGGREHALARALVRSRRGQRVLVAPGNGGVSSAPDAWIRRLEVDTTDREAVVELARRHDVELAIVGPEAPLVAGLVDALDAAGILAFGPTAAAARLEASKAFLKDLARRRGIPTARFAVAHTMAEVEAAIGQLSGPPVIKADGLCAGKGVVVADSRAEALAAARDMIERRIFGESGATVVVEERIRGREISLLVVTDGERWLTLPPARDHKRVGEGDSGPNTGGMGVVCPAPGVDGALVARIEREIVAPTLAGMRDAGAPFRGVLFAGVMVDDAGDPFLLEHNVRFGDPECEAVLELVDGDVGALLASAARGALDPSAVRVRRDLASCVVVLAAAGYPGAPRTGDPIAGVDEAGTLPEVRIHHAGTAVRDGQLVTAGGRVLAVTARAPTLGEARDRAYRAAGRIRFEGCHYRRDVGGPPWTP